MVANCAFQQDRCGVEPRSTAPTRANSGVVMNRLATAGIGETTLNWSYATATVAVKSATQAARKSRVYGRVAMASTRSARHANELGVRLVATASDRCCRVAQNDYRHRTLSGSG